MRLRRARETATSTALGGLPRGRKAPLVTGRSAAFSARAHRTISTSSLVVAGSTTAEGASPSTRKRSSVSASVRTCCAPRRCSRLAVATGIVEARPSLLLPCAWRRRVLEQQPHHPQHQYPHTHHGYLSDPVGE